MHQVSTHRGFFASPNIHKTLSANQGRRGYAQIMSEDIRTIAGNRILQALERTGMTQAEFCRTVEWLSPTRLNNWIKGERMIGVEEAKTLAPLLKTSAAYLLTVDDNPGDPREDALLSLYRHSDERGKSAIFRVAEGESDYKVSSNHKKSHAA